MDWDQRLRDKFAETGWSKAELARRSGVGYDNVTKYLAGKVDKSRGDTLNRIAKVLGTTAIWLEHGSRPLLVKQKSLSSAMSELARKFQTTSTAANIWRR